MEALVCHRRGDVQAAARLYEQVLELDPEHARALQSLGALAGQAGDKRLAERLLRRAVESDPRDAVSWNNLGSALKEQGKLHEAVSAYRSALRARPDYAIAQYNLGLALQSIGEIDGAVDAFRRLVKLTPDDPDAWNKLGGALLDHGDPQGAHAAHREALRLEPADADALNGVGLVCMDQGDFEAAAAHYRLAIGRAAQFSKAYLNLAKSHRFLSKDDPDLDLILAALARPGWTDEGSADLHFAMGKVLDDLGRFEEAFSHYATANRLKRRRLVVDRDAFTAAIDQLIETFSADLFQSHREFGDPSPLPVFIVGMPRSGTTLVEQIIASHPAVLGAGELGKVNELATKLPEVTETRMPYPQCVSRLDVASSQTRAREHLDYLRARAPGASRVTDKMPRNYLHLGLIAILFPGATLIECRRDAMDVCLSIFFHQFAAPYPLGYDLADIAFEHREYQRLMAHWRTALPLEIHAVDYEDLVADPEPAASGLINHCGLPWDARCLRFHENPRAVHTASNWQVRQPLYCRSIARWHHYERFLGELRDELSRAD